MEILKNAEYMPTRVWTNIYVWSPGGRRPPEDRSRCCVISAHGIHKPGPSKYPAPKNVTLVYYSPHGYGLHKTQVLDLATGNLPHFAKVEPGRAMNDYLLTKYQEEDRENYKTIQRGITRAGQIEKARTRYMIKPADVGMMHRRGTEEMEKMAQRLKESLEKIKDPIHDVVTIRRRKAFSPPTLFEVIHRLERDGFSYGEVHCGFCKGYEEGGSGPWSPKERNLPSAL